MSLVEQIEEAWPVETWRDVSLIVGVSGGADSVALLRALAELKTSGEGTLVAAHFNHQLRGADSDADQTFVADLCRTLNIRLVTGYAADFAEEQKRFPQAPEVWARKCRYIFFNRVAKEVGARYVALAHTADDQVETILHRIVRGTGLAGLAGIPRTRSLGLWEATIVRPLLATWRSEVLAYLAARGQKFREDLSNNDRRYTRNRIRHELLPLLRRDFNPQVQEAILRLGRLANEAQTLLDELVETLTVEAHVRPRFEPSPTGHECGQTSSIELSGKNLASQSRYLVRELLVRQWRAAGWSERYMGWAEWDWLAGVLMDHSTSGVRILPGLVRAEYGGGQLVLSRPLQDDPNA